MAQQAVGIEPLYGYCMTPLFVPPLISVAQLALLDLNTRRKMPGALAIAARLQLFAQRLGLAGHPVERRDVVPVGDLFAI